MLAKKLLTLAIAVVAIGSSTAFAEETVNSADNFNIRFGPVALLIGVVNIGVDVAVHDQLTIGPEVSYLHWNLSSSGAFTTDYDIRAYAAGLRANWYANGVFTDGLYIAPKISYSKATVSSSDSTGTVEGEASVFVATGLVGYAWFWDGFNIHLGGGASLPVGDGNVKIKDSTGQEDSVSISRTGNLALEFDLGWTF